MNTERLYADLSPVAYTALTNAAKVHALELRRDAIRAFWSALGRSLRSAWQSGLSGVPARRRRCPPQAQPCSQ